MQTRREALRHAMVVTGLLATAGFLPRTALAFNKVAFDARTVGDAVRAYGGAMPVESRDVSLTAPDIAENGAVVQMGLATTAAGVKHLLLLVEKNPNTLVARFEVSDAVEPSFTLRAKMAQSSDVYAVAILADGKAIFARKEVKVTLGGCGN